MLTSPLRNLWLWSPNDIPQSRRPERPEDDGWVSDAHILFTLASAPVSHCVQGGEMWFWLTSSILHVIITCYRQRPLIGWFLQISGVSLVQCVWHGGGAEAMPGGFADNVKTAAFFVCDFYKIWWATIYTWITFKTVRASDQALNWLDVKYLCVQSFSCM